MRRKQLYAMVSGTFVALTTVNAAANNVNAPAESRAGDWTPKYHGVWDAEKDYKGDYRNGVGDTVQYKDINGNKMYWWAKFASKGDVPGMFAPEGGTSPWVLINSKSYDPNGSAKYEWKGWNGDLKNSLSAGQAAVPTWKNGAEGAYTIIQDDIGAIPHETGIKPGHLISLEYPDIRTGWGVFVRRGDENDYWDEMREMVRAGHEMVCHSFHHTSAAEQWAWGKVGETLPTSVQDPSIPLQLGGLTVVGASVPDKNPNDWTKAYTRITAQTELGTIEYSANWTGSGPASNIGETVTKEKKQITIEPVKVTPAPGVEIVEFLGVKYYVKYTKKDVETGQNEGYALATKVGWEDYAVVDGVPTMDDSYKADGGRAIWTFKAKAADSWADRNAWQVEIRDATDRINEMVYDKIKAEDGHFGSHFNADKKCEYFVYPFDAYSDATHDSIMNYGYVAARGGAKSGMPMPGDFYNPTRIDFDAFYMVDENHTTLFPKNPHSILTLQGMVDQIVETKGYMIRELHAIVDVQGDWKNVNDNSKGGWWGGITTTLYRKHMEYLQGLIDGHRLVVYTPSEAIRYRMTANNVTGASMNKVGNTWEVDVTATDWVGGDNRWEDEISVIIKLDQGVDKMDVTYKNGAAHPYTHPRKMSDDGTAWSINVNPYNGTAIVHPGKDWDGPKTGTTAISEQKATYTKQNVKASVKNMALSIQLPKGNYSAQLYSLRGQLIKEMAISSLQEGAVNSVSLSNLAQGFVVLKIMNSEGAHIFTDSFIIK